jgi:tetratricopeptide (TPR) repeat protein
MRPGFSVALFLAGCLLAAQHLDAQTPAGGDAAGTNQSKPAAAAQKPAAPAQSGANPFPEDINSVPVMPSTTAPDLPEGTYSGSGSAGVSLPGFDADPVRSPDDPAPDTANQQDQGWSSSLKDMSNLEPPPETAKEAKKHKKDEAAAAKPETAASDIDVGKYYLDRKNWKAALSRFESALVLDPEDPEVYWGLAESERNLNDFANARTYYLKVMEYDPDSRHSKDARKALDGPEFKTAQNHAQSQPAPGPPQ